MGNGASDEKKATPAPPRDAQQQSSPKAAQALAAHSAPTRNQAGTNLKVANSLTKQGSTMVPLNAVAENKRLQANLQFNRRKSNVGNVSRIKGLIHADDDDFESIDIGGGAPQPAKKKDDIEGLEGARFGRGGVDRRDELMGNQVGGDMTNAGKQNLKIGKDTEGANVEERTINGRKQKNFFSNDADIDDEPSKATSAFSKVERNAKKAALQQELARRQSLRDMTSGSKDDQQDENVHVVNGTPKVKQLIEQIRQFRFNMRNKREVSDSDIGEMQQIQEHYGKLKQHVAQQIAALGPKIDIVGRPNKEAVVEFATSLIAESDSRPGNVEVLGVFFKHLHTIEWAKIALQDQWVETCALEGFPRFLELIFALPHLCDDPSQMFHPLGVLSSCVQNKRVRIPLGVVITKYWAVMRLQEFKTDMKDLWQQLFTDVASHKRAIANEDRAARMILLQKILGLTDFIDIDVCLVDAEDEQTILSRCIIEGDTTLFTMICKSTLTIRYNMKLPDANTVLSLACKKEQKLMVDLLCSIRDVDPMVEIHGEGNALEICRRRNINPQITAAVERRVKRRGSMVDPSMLSSPVGDGGKEKDKFDWTTKEKRLPSWYTDPPTANEDDSWTVDSESDVVNGVTDKIRTLLESLEEYWRNLTAVKNELLNGSPEAEAEYLQLEGGLADFKQALAIKIQTIGGRIAVEGRDGKDQVIRMVERLLQEQEIEGNLELLRTLLYRIVTVDFAPMISEKGWAISATQSGLPTTLDVLLRVPKLWKDDQEVVELAYDAAHHPTKRIPLLLVILKHDETLRVGTYREHLRPIFDELWDSLCSGKAMPGEEYSQRGELLFRMANHPHIQLRYDFEMGGGQTYFSRACREGDVDLVKTFLDLVMVDVNRIHTNKSTALLQAVVGNQTQIVKMLLKEVDIDAHYRSPHGTALELAQKMNKDPALVGALKNWHPRGR